MHRSRDGSSPIAGNDEATAAAEDPEDLAAEHHTNAEGTEAIDDHHGRQPVQHDVTRAQPTCATRGALDLSVPDPPEGWKPGTAMA